MSGAFGLDRIGQVHVGVTDVGRATGFYRDVLGIKHLFEFPGMSFFDCGGVRLYLAPPEPGAGVSGTSILYFKVPDIAEAAEVLEGRGVVFKRRPHLVHRDERHELWLGFFEDSEGNTLALMSEVPKASS